MPDPIVAVERESDVVFVRALVERFDEEQVRRFQELVRSAADANPGVPFVLDLAAINFLPSLSLAALVRLATDFRSRPQRLLLAGLQPQVREVFVHSRLDRLFEIHDDAAAAARTVRLN